MIIIMDSLSMIIIMIMIIILNHSTWRCWVVINIIIMVMILITTCRSPRNFDAVLGLYNDHNDHHDHCHHLLLNHHNDYDDLGLRENLMQFLVSTIAIYVQTAEQDCTPIHIFNISRISNQGVGVTASPQTLIDPGTGLQLEMVYHATTLSGL